MALFAIVKTADDSVEEFREAVDAATALADFVAKGGYQAADYFAHDTTARDSFSTKPNDPGDDNVWKYDSGTDKLVTASAPAATPNPQQLYLKSPDGSTWEITITDAGVLETTKL